jgi:hypothetical protein
MGLALLLLFAGSLAVLLALSQSASASPPLNIKGQTPESPLTCGPDWTAVPSGNESTHDNELNAVAAVSGNDVWAVGYYIGSTGEQTLIEHWNGSGWSVVSSPNHGMYINSLNEVAAVSSGNVWAVGYYINSSNAYQTLIEHWNGTAWSLSTSANTNMADNELYGVAAISSSDVWAVGYAYSSSHPARTLIERWNGSAWHIVASDNATSSSNELYAVTAVSASDVWAVGNYYGSSGEEQTLTERWNGTAWNVVTSDNANTNVNALYAVAALSASDVWAVGYYVNGTGLRTLTERWNGSTWNVVNSPSPSPTFNNLLGIAAISGNNLIAVGSYTSSGTQNTLIEHWDGTSWSRYSSPDGGSSNNLFNGVAALTAGDMWAMGSYENASAVSRTFIARYHPCPATPTNTPIPFPTQCAINFADVPNPSTFYPYVQCLACRGIVSGFACGGTNEPCDPNNDPYFRPHNDVSRGQLAKIVARSAQINIAVSGQTFEDVPPGSAFYTYTEQLHTLGVMGGYACGGTNEPCVPPLNRPYFRPHNSATRGQLAKIDSNTAGYNDIPALQVFEDIAVGSTYYTYTYRLVSRSIMTGYPCGGAGEPCVPPLSRPYFRPNNNVTRGQTSKIVANTFYPNCQAP